MRLNRQKDQRGLDEWRPPNKAIWGEYAVRWLYVKMKYRLHISFREAVTAAEMLLVWSWTKRPDEEVVVRKGGE